MAVSERKVRAGRTVAILQSRREGNHRAPREAKKKETPEAQKAGNLRRAVQKLTWLMNTNFRDGDLLVTLDYKQGKAPKGSTRMHKDFDNFYARMKRRLKKRGVSPPKYIRVVEVGPRGGRHHHMMIREIPDALNLLRECWPEGGVNIKPLYTDGNYRAVAEYFVKYTQKTMQTENRASKKLWYPARGLKQPKIGKPKVIKSRELGQVKVPKGYYLDKESVREGISAYDGYQTFSYLLVRLPDRTKGRGGGRDG